MQIAKSDTGSRTRRLSLVCRWMRAPLPSTPERQALSAEGPARPRRVTLRPLDELDVRGPTAGRAGPELRRLTRTRTGRSPGPTSRRWLASRGDARRPIRLGRHRDRRRWVGSGDCARRTTIDDRQRLGRLSGSHWTAGRGRGSAPRPPAWSSDFAFGELGLYRVRAGGLRLSTSGPRSRTRSPGSRSEGVKRGGLLWDGHRHDVICMAALNPAGNAQVAGTVEGSVRRSGTLVTTSAPVHATHDRRPGGHHTRGPRS